jgi:hypothetical protein
VANVIKPKITSIPIARKRPRPPGGLPCSFYLIKHYKIPCHLKCTLGCVWYE